MDTCNACVRLVDDTGQVNEPHYTFSISQQAFRRNPCRTGVLYLLCGEKFGSQPHLRFGPYHVRINHLARPALVKPYDFLEFAAQDFPLLVDIRGLDVARLEEYWQAMATGAHRLHRTCFTHA
jgi:hypothetical protein